MSAAHWIVAALSMVFFIATAGFGLLTLATSSSGAPPHVVRLWLIWTLVSGIVGSVLFWAAHP